MAWGEGNLPEDDPDQGNLARGLIHAFGIIDRIRVIALVGGGGKTSLMYALAREMVDQGKTVISTTTTKIYPPNASESPHLILADNDPHLTELSALLSEFKHVTVGRSIDPSSTKMLGLPVEKITALSGCAHWVLVEADGAAGRPVKAPAEWEPVIPPCSDLVIAVVGLDCLGRPAEEKTAFRLEKFLDLTGLRRGDLITPESIGRLLTHDEGGLKRVAPGMDVVPFLNKLDVLNDSAPVIEIINTIRQRGRARIQRIVTGSLRDRIQVNVYGCGELNGGHEY